MLFFFFRTQDDQYCHDVLDYGRSNNLQPNGSHRQPPQEMLHYNKRQANDNPLRDELLRNGSVHHRTEGSS